MSNTTGKITAYILAGGQGSRMGGADKGLLSLHGRPLVEHVIDRIQPQVDQLKIIANRNQATYKEHGLPVLADILPDYAGPLVGMLTGLTDCETDYALFVPADAPNLPHDLV
ncbi:MAG: molybdenum cofactor guanylyltransferase, partial [Salinisphaeraceae bacterium]|nr:molybdenum cofactor guanylyltransferase [Salinisphaeraceae bacterium]